MLRYAMSERHSLAPGHRGQVESCGPVAEETDFTAPLKPTSLHVDASKHAPQRSSAEFCMGCHSETCATNFILVRYIHTLQKLSFHLYNFQTDVSVHKILVH